MTDDVSIFRYVFGRLTCSTHCYHISKHSSSLRVCCHCGKNQYLVRQIESVPGHGRYCRDGEEYSEWEDASEFGGL